MPIHTADADATQPSSRVESRRVVSAVWTEFATSSRRLPTDSVDNLDFGNWPNGLHSPPVRVATTDTTQLDFAVGKFVQTRWDGRQLVANCVHIADTTQLDSSRRRRRCVLGFIHSSPTHIAAVTVAACLKVRIYTSSQKTSHFTIRCNM